MGRKAGGSEPRPVPTPGCPPGLHLAKPWHQPWKLLGQIQLPRKDAGRAPESPAPTGHSLLRDEVTLPPAVAHLVPQPSSNTPHLSLCPPPPRPAPPPPPPPPRPPPFPPRPRRGGRPALAGPPHPPPPPMSTALSWRAKQGCAPGSPGFCGFKPPPRPAGEAERPLQTRAAPSLD